MLYSNFMSSLTKSDTLDTYTNGAKFPDEVLQNKKDLIESEEKIIMSEIKRYSELTSSKDQVGFMISNECKLLIFKIFAFLVDSR